MSGKRENDPSVGDEVTWKSHGSTAHGKVEKKVSKRTKEAGRTVAASPDDPQYVVRSDKSGKKAVHKPSALRKGKNTK
jgi:Hypervirulence associated proteins TUDOR domain